MIYKGAYIKYLTNIYMYILFLSLSLLLILFHKIFDCAIHLNNAHPIFSHQHHHSILNSIPKK